MDAHVTVIETSTGKKLTGEEAPTRKELEKWLADHPGLVVWNINILMRIWIVFSYVHLCRYEEVNSEDEAGSGVDSDEVCIVLFYFSIQ